MTTTKCGGARPSVAPRAPAEHQAVPRPSGPGGRARRVGRRVERLALAAALALGTAALAGCRDRAEPRPPRPSLRTAADRPATLAVIPPAAAAPPPADPSGLGLHQVAPAELPELTFSARGGGVAFVVPAGEGGVVHHGSRVGKAYRALGELALSPDGRRLAHGALVDGRWRMVVDGLEGAPYAAVQGPVFDGAGTRLAYQALEGEAWLLVVDGAVRARTAARFAWHALSADGARLAYLEVDEGAGRGRLVVLDLASGEAREISGRATRAWLDEEGRWLVAVEAGPDGERALWLRLDRPQEVRRSPAFESVQGVSFGPEGVPPAAVGVAAGRAVLAWGDRTAPLAPGAMALGVPAVGPGGPVALEASDQGTRLVAPFGASPPAGEAWEEAEGLTADDAGRVYAFAARRGSSWHVVVDGRAGPPFDRVVTPRFFPDGRRVAYRARLNGRRFVVVADASGRTLRRLPDHDQVFPVLFTPDGRKVAHGYVDGAKVGWAVEAP